MSHEQQPEHTLITAVQQGVADAIEMFRAHKNALLEAGSSIAQITPHFNLYTIERDRHKVGATHYFRLQKTVDCYLSDRASMFANVTDYHDHAYWIFSPAVLFHRAVFNELRELFGDAPFAHTDYGWVTSLAEIEHLVYDDVEALLADELFSIHVENGKEAASLAPNDLPQLQLNRNTINPGKYLDIHDRRWFTVFDAKTPLWQVREQLRLKSGVYHPLPDKVLEQIPQAIRDTQFPHLAIKTGNQGMIAFTQSPHAGVLDRQQVIKPGRYLRQVCPDLSDEEVKQASADVMGCLTADIHHGKTEEEYARVFIEGPDSCMGGKTDDKFDKLYVNGSFYHPSRVYAHPDNHIEIVWLEVNGRISARTLINTKNKKWVRIYSNDSVANAASRLQTYLEGLGYSRSDYALNDEKLLRVAPDRYPNACICPYIDMGNQGVTPFEGYLLIDGEGSEANHETGCLSDFDVSNEADWYCDHCGDGMDDYDERHVTNHHHSICSSCANRDFTWARRAGTGDWFYVNDGEDFYDCQTTGDKVFFHTHYDWEGYRRLNEDIHYSDEVAEAHECIEHEGDDYVLISAVECNGLFIDRDSNIACVADNWAVLDGELTHIDNIDEDECQDAATPSDSPYPMLNHYTTLEQEDAA